MAWKFPQLTRRAFLQTTAATAVIGVIGSSKLATASLPSWSDLKFAKKKRHEMEEKISFSVCNFCSGLCNVEVRTLTHGDQSRMVKLEGNPISKMNRGRLCARGQAGLFQTYDTDRIKTPLIRVEGSKRGEMKFRKASWEEAYAYIASKSQNLDPWEWTIVGGWSTCVFFLNPLFAFAHANRTPNFLASPMQHCVTTGELGTDSVTGNFKPHGEILPNYDNARYILLVINNSSIAGVNVPRAVQVTEAKQRGAKIVALDPRVSETVAIADEWVRIRPGTDLDFMLALIREIMTKDYYDEAFCKKHTDLSFLLYNDEGEWRPMVNDKGEPMVWDQFSQSVKTVNAYSNNNDLDVTGQPINPALRLPTQDMQVNGKTVSTVFEAQLAEIDHCTPEWAAASTTIEAKTLVRIAYEFTHIKPAIIDPGWMGARYNNIQMLRRAQATLQTLIGGVDTIGGWVNSAKYHKTAAKMHEARVQGKTMANPLTSMTGLPGWKAQVEFFSDGDNFGHGYPAWSFAFSKQEKAAGRPYVSIPFMADTGLYESVEGKLLHKGKPYKTKAFLAVGANPVHHYFPAGRWKDMLSSDQVDLVVAVDVLPSDTTAYADVILPESTYLERDEIVIGNNGISPDLSVTTRFKAIDPLYDTKSTTDILFELTQAMSGDAGLDRLYQSFEVMVGPKAEMAKKLVAEFKAKNDPAPYTAAYRQMGMAGMARAVGTTPENLEKVLKEKGIYEVDSMESMLEKYAMPRKIPVLTPSGRLEIYSSFYDSLRVDGKTRAPNFSVLATDMPSGVHGNQRTLASLKGDEFYFTYGKTPTVSHGSTNVNNAVLHAINVFKEDIHTGVWINDERARTLGIKTGDPIKVTNNETPSLFVTGKAYVTNQIHEDTAFMYSSFGSKNKSLTRAANFGSAINNLIGYKVDPVVAGFRSQEFTIKIEKV
ncbi:molybdopterin-dependent oxidoreductase [Thiomicrospira sp. R3]|uniref:molybdopterin-dependent oxidoreductase n=1 Tax=Thiomicrospira sp. R3 TaxID=3035472 RepID=UPI00259B98EC|nr:molybdopterin-dependent oxidoreductase [Thiomicrospira sp. R3]WFE69558.1 molybdopterin-dependent oxidoreductase [Thiomicrospira sp. R3]